MLKTEETNPHRLYIIGWLMFSAAALLLLPLTSGYYKDQETKDIIENLTATQYELELKLQNYINTVSFYADIALTSAETDELWTLSGRTRLVNLTYQLLLRNPNTRSAWIWLEPSRLHGDWLYRGTSSYPDEGRFFVSFVRRSPTEIIRTYDLVQSNKELSTATTMEFYDKVKQTNRVWIDVDAAGYTYANASIPAVPIVVLSYPILGKNGLFHGAVGLDFITHAFLTPKRLTQMRTPYNLIITRKDGTILSVTSSGFAALGANIYDETRVWQPDLVALAPVLAEHDTQPKIVDIHDYVMYVLHVPYSTYITSEDKDCVTAAILVKKEDIDSLAIQRAQTTVFVSWSITITVWTLYYILHVIKGW